MEFKKFLSRVLSMTMCMVMVFTTCSFAEPVMEVADHQHEEEVFTYDVETPVEEQGEVSLDMEMPEVFDKVEIIELDDLPELDIRTDCDWHFYENGVCRDCGHVCNHEIQDKGTETVSYEKVDEKYHIRYYVDAVYCIECDEILEKSENVESYKEEHGYWCDCDYEDIDDSDDGDNVCVHSNLVDMGFDGYWDEDAAVTAWDENGHTLKMRVYHETYCGDCDTSFFEPTDEFMTLTEVHNWEYSSCAQDGCDAVCSHDRVVDGNVLYHSLGEYIDESTHKDEWELYLIQRCVKCEKHMEQFSGQTIEVIVPHDFRVKDIWDPEKEDYVFQGYECGVCDYFTTDESIVGQIAEMQKCNHENVEEELYYECYSKKIDSETHTARYEAWLEKVCQDCGKVLDYGEHIPEKDYECVEPHSMVPTHYEDYPFSYVVCGSCEYMTECDHANATIVETSEAFCYSNITETTHDSVGAGYDVFYCPDCGITYRSANGKKVNEIAEPHKFVDGVCACGYACVHTPELEKWDEFECTEETHTIDHYELEKCTTCGYIIMETQSSKTEAHDMKDGICTVCGFGDIHTVVLPETMKLGLKESAVMPMSYLPAAAENTVRFESSNKSVVTIDAETGKMTAKKTGKATITAIASEGVLATCVVSVQKAPTSVKPSVSKLTLGVGEGYTMGVKLSSGSASNQITYSSSNPDVATIDENGVITPVSSGTTKITVKTFNKKSGTATLTVKAAPETATITTTETTLSVGQTAKLSAQLLDGAGKATAGAYTYSIDSDCATLENGVVTATQAGTVNAIVTAYNGVTANVTIEILPAPDKAVASVESATLGVGEKLTVTAEIENGSPADFKYKSSKSSVASVTSSGRITAKKAGKATITIQPHAGESATVQITVKNAPKSVKVSAKSKTLAVGETFRLTAAPNSGAASKITWKTSKSSIVSVDQDGNLTAVGTGKATITASTFNGKKATCTVTVKAAPANAEVTAAKVVLSEGQKTNLTVKLTDANGKATVGAYTYAVDNDCGTVEKGVFTALKAGEATVTVETYNGVTANVAIEVLPAPDKAVASIESATLGVGEKAYFTVDIENGSPADFTYKTSNKKVATVTASGKITGVKAGKATITVQPHAGEAATIEVTVMNAPKSVKLSSKSRTMGVGDTYQLTYGLSSKSTSKITWKSSKSSVATVDQNGNITAVKPGKATITASTFNGKKATCTVTVKAAPTSITLSAARDVLSVGQKVKLNVALNKNSAGTYAFSVQPEGKVTIEKGYIVAHEASDTPITITATTYNGLTSSVTVNVLPAPDKALVDVANNKITLRVKKSYTLKPYIANGSPADFKYKSSKSSVATVSSSGKITAKKKGTAKITITPHIGEPVVVTVVVK